MVHEIQDYRSGTLRGRDARGSEVLWHCWSVGEMVFTEWTIHGRTKFDFVDSLNDPGATKARRIYRAKIAEGFVPVRGRLANPW